MEKSNLTKWQRDVLNALLDRYERSKSYTGENQVGQSFAVDPVRVFPSYRDNGENVERIDLFEEEMRELASRGLVQITRSGGEIAKITAVKDEIPQYYSLLNRKSRAEIRSGERDFFIAWQEKGEPSSALSGLCAEQVERIDAGKKPLYTPEAAEPLLRALEFIEHNTEDILERELSIAVYGDTKLFEHRYRAKVCRILENYAENGSESAGGPVGGRQNSDRQESEERRQEADALSGEDARERQIALLERYHIYANPSYVYVNGNAEIAFQDGSRMELRAGAPAALSADAVQRISRIHPDESVIMTVENLTSFNRLKDENVFFLYLAGYHNTLKNRFLALLRQGGEDTGLTWYHFGDIDPDGFLILEHLKRESGLPVRPYRMGTDELQKYSRYTRKLEENDRVKAENLMQRGMYTDEMGYMLSHDCKLEQEIISWLEAGDNVRPLLHR